MIRATTPTFLQVSQRGRDSRQRAAPEDGLREGEDGQEQGGARREQHGEQDGAAGARQGRARVQAAPRRATRNGGQVRFPTLSLFSQVSDRLVLCGLSSVAFDLGFNHCYQGAMQI